MNTYFITGATGVVGSAVVRELLARSSCRLILLIRAQNNADLQKRTHSLLNFLNVDATTASARIEPLLGDTEVDRFGVNSQDYQRLTASVTHIIHSAASVRMNLPIELARRTAVAATENVMQLAQLCHAQGTLQKVEMISTVGVGGRRPGPLPEVWMNEPRNFHNTYEQAKAEAETIIERHLNMSLPVTVHRPSMVVGDSHTGRIPHFQIFYHLAEFISGRRTFGLLPDLANYHVDVVPSDYVAQAIVWSSSTQVTNGKILHLCGGAEKAVTLKSLKAIVLAKFNQRDIAVPKTHTMPIAWFSSLVRLITPFTPQRIKRALATLPIFLDYLAEEQVFGNTHTRQLLEAVGIVLPEGEIFLDTVLDYYISQTY